MPAFEPRAGIGNQREAGCVAFREAVAAELLQLAEGALGVLALVAVGDHALNQLLLKAADHSQ